MHRAAVDLAARGHYLVFRCLAERTIALAQEARRRDPDAGFDPLLTERSRRCWVPAWPTR
jgi:hypothetical protein